MEYLASADEMQKIDEVTIKEIGIPGPVLMERAAMAVAETIMQRFDREADILVVAESGNNGGDGLAIARMLILKGYSVDVCHIAAIRSESESFTLQKQILSRLGIPVLSDIPDRAYDLVVDAIFGVGLTRTVAGVHRQMIERLNAMKTCRLAVDIPSGLNAATGQAEGICVCADITVTFGLCKRGMVLYPGRQFCGEIILKDIGFPNSVIERIAPSVYTYRKEDLARIPARAEDSNKGTYGRVAVIAGSADMSGAAYLAAGAAYRMGCGLVKVYTHENNRTVIGCHLPEALLMTYQDEKTAFRCVEDAVRWGTVILAGPGIGTEDIAGRMIEQLLRICDIPLVIDADGLNVLMGHTELLSSAGCPVIVTPHLKEMSRLTGKTVEAIKEKPDAVCSEFAEKHGVVCVLKDARTWVCDGTDRRFVNTSGNNGMSTAGSGDVLAGMLAGLCGLHMDAAAAARLGVYLHGLAGDYAAKKLGTYSMLAGDILEEISQVLGGNRSE